jgi:hypothetical protein
MLLMLFSVSCSSESNNVSNTPIKSINNAGSEISLDKPYISTKSTLTGIINDNDNLVFLNENGYFYNYNSNNFKMLGLNSNLPSVRQYQYFLSDNGEFLYYNTNSSSVEGKLCYYDINNNKYGDILDEFGIKINGYVCLASYKDDKIIILEGSSDKDNSKKETKTLIEIDLKEKTHKLINLPIVPSGAWIYNGLSYVGSNIGILCSYKEQTEGSHQELVIFDREGNILNEIPIREKDIICNISVSPDGNKFTFQTGTTPTDLNLFNIKSNEKKEILSNAQSKGERICSYSIWGKDNSTIYYETVNTVEKDPEKIYELNVADGY